MSVMSIASQPDRYWSYKPAFIALQSGVLLVNRAPNQAFEKDSPKVARPSTALCAILGSLS